MLDGLLGRNNFKTKCKSAVTPTKTRLEIIKKKKRATQKFLKEDIAELLKKNLYRHAYSRAEGLYMEMNSSSCYDYIEECCNCIADHLKELHQQRECPKECKVAAASLIYAAARFADLPELRDLRAQFNDKYSNSLEPFVSKEFVEKLKSKPPTREMKLRLIQDVAQEFSVTWDPKSLEQQLQSSSTTAQDYHLARSSSVVVRGKLKQNNSNNRIDEGISQLRHSRSSREDVSHKPKEKRNRTEPRIPSFSSRHVAKDNANRKSLLTDGTVLPPYTIPNYSRRKEGQNHQNMENAVVIKPRPRSLITKLFKQSQSTVSSTSEEVTDAKESLSAKGPGEAKHGLRRGGKETKSGSFISYSKMEFPNAGTLSVNSNNGQPATQDLPLPPWRRRYMFPQPASLLKEANEITTRKSVLGHGEFRRPIIHFRRPKQ